MTTAAEPPQGRESPSRRNPSALDLLRSLLPLTLLILLVVWLYSPDDPAAVTAIDPAPELAYAATLVDFDVLAAEGLPSGWRPTSAALTPSTAKGPHTVRVGYVTPQERFAQVVQSDRPRSDLLDDVLGPDVTGVGPVDIAGVVWDGLRTADRETALVRQEGTATVVVTGSAPLDVLTGLAGSLRPVTP
ncbi:MAG: DUF4245 domain-containing protein [Geodermatophilaceae bacterium]|nr:DUF4245 domain-containing protein [Geodermatophilaceae bacterium]